MAKNQKKDNTISLIGLTSLFGMSFTALYCYYMAPDPSKITLKNPTAMVEVIPNGIKFTNDKGQTFYDLGFDGNLDRITYNTPDGREVTIKKGSQEFERFIPLYERLRQELSENN